MKACYVHEACDIHINVCYLLYDILFLLYVFYIELELSLASGIKSVLVVKVYLCTFIITWLSLTSETSLPIRCLIMSMLSFKRRMLIIPRIRISAGQEGII